MTKKKGRTTVADLEKMLKSVTARVFTLESTEEVPWQTILIEGKQTRVKAMENRDMINGIVKAGLKEEIQDLMAMKSRLNELISTGHSAYTALDLEWVLSGENKS